MADLYLDPVSYGITDLALDGADHDVEARVYYPSLEGTVRDVAVRPGHYPLLAFAHGNRSGDPSLCPTDLTQDHTRWTAVLHALAKSGYVVVVPALSDVIGYPEATAARLRAAIGWMRGRWEHREVLHRPPVLAPARIGVARLMARVGHFPGSDRPVWGAPTPTGIIGHSWGARAATQLLSDGEPVIATFAAVAGTFDDNESIVALGATPVSTLLLAGADDAESSSYLKGLWRPASAPRTQALLHGIGHWDWFTRLDGIHPCDRSTPEPACGSGWRIAAELLLGFERKYLHGVWSHPPQLIGPSLTRQTVDFDNDGRCATVVRWDDPGADRLSLPQRRGQRLFGTWARHPWS